MSTPQPTPASSRIARALVALCLVLAAVWALGPSQPLVDTPQIAVKSADPAFSTKARKPTAAFVPSGTPSWVSLRKEESGTGTVVLGPFAAPRIFSIGCVGYPRKAGNTMYLERLSTGEKADVPCANGKKWSAVRVPVPEAWAGDPVQLVVVDGSVAPEGWMGFSAPFEFRSSSDVLFVPFWVYTLRAFLLSWGVLLGLGFLVLDTRWCRGLPVAAQSLGAVGAVFALGYGIFWLYFLGPSYGIAASWIAIALAAMGWLRALSRPRDYCVHERGLPLFLMGLIGAFMVVLLTFGVDHYPLTELARDRLTRGLSVDNYIPGIFTERLFNGVSPKRLIGNWLSSDRPPLQVGWLLIQRPFMGAFSVEPSDGNYVAGIVAQLAWVPAVWFVVRWLKLSKAATWQICFLLAATGFIAQHTIYVWPKMCAGAFTLGAVVLLLAKDEPQHAFARWTWSALFAVCAMMGHGGAMFALVAAAPFALVRRPWHTPKAAIAGVLIIAAGLVPWMCYQKFYEPPGDRLVKWHLSGKSIRETDPRPLFVVLKEGYMSLTLAQHIRFRLDNVIMQFQGDYSGLHAMPPVGIPGYRVQEWEHVFRAVGWWNLGWLSLVFLPNALRRSRQTSFALGRWARLAAWQGASFVAWVLLLFSVAHPLHASYSYMILLFLLPGVLAYTLARPLFVVMALLSVRYFVLVWRPGTVPLMLELVLLIGGASLSMLLKEAPLPDASQSVAPREGTGVETAQRLG